MVCRAGDSVEPVARPMGTRGVVTEGDLILRQEPQERSSWWRTFLDDPDTLARQYRKATCTTVGEVMSRPAISVPPSLPIESVAVILHRRRVRRLPVVDGGRLVGIVSRGDLVKALAAEPPPAAASRSDAALVEEMRTRLSRESWAAGLGVVVHADRGTLVLWATSLTEAEKAALETMARSIPGVARVDSHLTTRGPRSIASGL
jgi:signal-transduction protein with cAMP-binding, CBS, and nucleotidyltransferase domain